MQTFVRSQADILSSLEDQVDDASNTRWTDARIYAAINQAIDAWYNRVSVPYIYTITNGWVAGTFEYTLPDYIDTRRIQPQIRRYRDETAYYLPDNGDGDTWADIGAFDIEPSTTSGGLVLRLHNSEYSVDGRIIWWAHNGHIPTSPPLLGANIDEDDTSLTTATKPTNIGRNGYVKIDSEWIGYNDVTEGTSSWTLSNLQRGLFNTTAASHTTADTIYWGVAAESPHLYRQLELQAKAHLAEYYLMNSSSRETQQYEKIAVLFQQQADNFWKSYTVQRPMRITLSRQAYG